MAPSAGATESSRRRGNLVSDETLKAVADEQSFASDRISNQVRLAAAGLLAVTWGLLIGEPEALEPITQQYRLLVLSIGFLAMLALMFDFVQYVLGYWYCHGRLRELERLAKNNANAQSDTGGSAKPAPRREPPFRHRNLLYRARHWAFLAKQITLGVAIVAFLFLVATYIGGSEPQTRAR